MVNSTKWDPRSRSLWENLKKNITEGVIDILWWRRDSRLSMHDRRRPKVNPASEKNVCLLGSWAKIAA